MEKSFNFNYVLDINGLRKRYPNNPNYVAFFNSANTQFFIYALCTKRNFSEPELIEIDAETYVNEIEDMIDRFGESMVENYVDNASEVKLLIDIAQSKADYDVLTIGDMLKL